MRGIIYISSILLIFAAGCSRYIESENFSQKLPDQPPIPTSLKATHLPDGLTLSWQVSDTTVIRFFRIYTADSLNGNYRIWDSTSGKAFSKPMLGLIAGQTYYFKVASITTGGLEGAMCSAISIVPGPLSIMINNDDEYTRSQNVTVTFTAPTATILVQLSENADFADARWEAIAPSLDKTLGLGDGVKRLYAKFQFNDGSESGGLIGDSIFLDTRAEIDTAYFGTDASILKAGDVITFFLGCGEINGEAAVSFSDISTLKLYDDGANGDLISGDGVYSRRYIIPVNMELVDVVVTGHFTDVAGNNSEERIFPFPLNISKAPDVVVLMATAQSSSSIRLSWSQSIVDDFAAYYVYRDSISTVSDNSPLATTITSRGALSYTDSNLKASAKYFYRVYVHDNTGLFTASEVSSATTAANLPPTAVKLAARADSLSSILTWSTNNDDDFSSYQIYRGTESEVSQINGKLLTIVNERAITTFTDTRPDSTTYYYKIFVYDKQGMTIGSNEVSVP